MKRFVSLFVFVCVYAISYAQMCVATLQHNDTISAFYGSNAFVEAHAAASHGDVITLSSGEFNACEITKAITLHGAGCIYNPETNSLPTKIVGNFSLNIPSDTTSLIMESIMFTGEICNRNVLYFPQFIKCNVNYLYMWSGSITNGQFINCIFRRINTNGHHASGNIVNSVVWECNDIDRISVYNSFIRDINGNKTYRFVYNSIINVPELSSNSVAYNCIGIRRSDHSVFCNIPISGNMDANSFEEVFETFDGNTFSYDEQYVLKASVAAEFLGNDGTEVGIHGGLVPFDQKSRYIVMKRCNVANRTTVDEKLSVDIEVIANDEE